MRLSLILVALIISFNSWGKVLNYKPIMIPVETGDRLQIEGFHGVVEIVGSNTSESLRLELSEEVVAKANGDGVVTEERKWKFSYDKDNGILRFKVKGPESKTVWMEHSKGKTIPQFTLKIISPSLPLDLSWKKGKISVKEWSQPMDISLLEGNVHVEGGQGNAMINNQKGQVNVSSREGEINVHAYDSKVNVKSSKGQLIVQNFIGQTLIQGADGTIETQSFKGPIRVAQSKGRLRFAQEQAKMRIDGFEGSINGESKQGPVVATMQGVVNMRVKTEQAPVYLKLKNSGAYVNLGTSEGALVAPRYLRRTQLQTIKLMRGRLRGKHKGSIHVRSESGTIQVR